MDEKEKAFEEAVKRFQELQDRIAALEAAETVPKVAGPRSGKIRFTLDVEFEPGPDGWFENRVRLFD
jgi:hypothetical protein